MGNFGFPALTWGFLLVLAPLLIHLIQLLRHRRVRWAAMDFLRQSYKKHRKWVWLRQFLLLLTRMGAMTLLVLLLAQWKPQMRLWGRWAGVAAHHYVLLDDSFSMQERTPGGSSAFEHAVTAIGRLLERAREDEGQHRVTLIRFSRAEAASQAQAAQGQPVERIADLNAEPIDARMETLWEQTRRQLTVSQSAATATAALKLLSQLLEQDDAPTKWVHVVSDFRKMPWANPSDLRAALSQVQAMGGQIEFIHCARKAQANLAVTRVEPEPGPRVAGVPLFVSVHVTNFSDQIARNVQLKVRTRFSQASQARQPGEDVAQVEELPVEMIDVIPPGQTVTRRVQVFFPQPGMHVVEAALPEDALPADNRRWCALDFQSGEPVLVVDGDSQQRHAYYLESIFQPGPGARTGIQPIVKDVAYLRDVPEGELARYVVVYLLDVPRLDTQAVQKLETFVRDGGGLAIFLGPNVERRFYNDTLYRDGQGVLPCPLEQQELMPPEETGEPDVNVDATDHPVFRDLLAGRNPLIRLMHVDRYFAPSPGWVPSPESTTQVIAALRSGHPFLLEKSFGNGRVVLCTTTYAPLWNDMVLGPNALIALQLQAYLAQGRRQFTELFVGGTLTIDLSLNEYLPQVKVVLPDAEGIPQRVIEHTLATVQEGQRVGRLTLTASSAADTGRSGIYELWAYRVDGNWDVRRYAINVDTRESDLSLVDMGQLVDSLAPVRVTWHYADQGQLDVLQQGGLSPSMLLLVVLVMLLLGEQALGFAASYHPPQGARI